MTELSFIFYYGIGLGILIGISLMVFLRSSERWEKRRSLPLSDDLQRISEALVECQSALNHFENGGTGGGSGSGSGGSGGRIKDQTYQLTNHLLQLDGITDQSLRPVRRATVVYVQAIQGHLDLLDNKSITKK